MKKKYREIFQRAKSKILSSSIIRNKVKYDKWLEFVNWSDAFEGFIQNNSINNNLITNKVIKIKKAIKNYFKW